MLRHEIDCEISAQKNILSYYVLEILASNPFLCKLEAASYQSMKRSIPFKAVLNVYRLFFIGNWNFHPSLKPANPAKHYTTVHNRINGMNFFSFLFDRVLLCSKDSLLICSFPTLPFEILYSQVQNFLPYRILIKIWIGNL